MKTTSNVFLALLLAGPGLLGVARAGGVAEEAKLKAGDKAWLVVLAPPSRMDNRGLTKDMFKVGTPATVEGYPSKLQPEEMRAERITIAGKTVELR